MAISCFLFLNRGAARGGPRGPVPPPIDGQVPLWRKSALRAEGPKGTFPPLLPFSALRAGGPKGTEGQKFHFEGPKETFYGNFMLFIFEQGRSQRGHRGHVPPIDGKVPLWRKSALQCPLGLRPEGH